MASSSSSSPLAPTLSSQSWKYDVFLSFRGEDVRKNFVDHLYKALEQQDIDTYKDDKILRQGESIHPSLMVAIEKSHIAVVIFSKNYANSSWCLDELTHIMKCKDTRGQIVMPIFYDVDPSEVRKQKRKYNEAFTKHELENKNKVESWRKALVDASNLCGWVPKNIANGHETEVIKEIVDKISLRLEPVTSSANEKLIGITSRVQRLKSELQIGSGGVIMIGIWGVGGGGKTTLASSIYDEICGKFDGCCFIANIREESRRHGLEKLIKEILSQTGANMDRLGRYLIERRLRKRKVLIVLDDVNQRDQLEALAGSPDWFGEGSRVIITTRDEHLLNAHKVVVHHISLLKSDEAFELFRKHSPQGSMPKEKYEQLSKEVVSYASGLPLALTVLGSSLCDKNIDQWRSALTRLKLIPDNEILEKLKISFDGLTKVQQDLFLDIACFFRWWKKDKAMKILDACGFHPVIGVKELKQKALITISGGKFDMHDLVQEMAHYIVRGEHPRKPEKHTRVWKKEDVPKICAMDATTELNIEAIQINYLQLREEPCPLPPIVANMGNLRYIQWKGHPLNPSASPLLNNFPPMGLCCLILSSASQDKLWNGNKMLLHLKIIELSNLDNLIMTPNFDGIPYLERFKLSSCHRLEEIHSSFGRLERLVSIRINHCSNIKMFPSITRLEKLQTLSFAGCPRLFELSEIQQKIENLRHLHLVNSGDTQIKKPGEDLRRLCFFCSDLRKLDLSRCDLGDEDISSAVWVLPNLEELNLSNNEFSRLNFSLIQTPRLKLLNVSACRGLVELLGLPPSIVVLNARNCFSLETYGDISNCKWLRYVSFCWADKVSPLAYKLVNSVLKVNAIEDHDINVILHHWIPKELVNIVGRLHRGGKFILHLPHGWYNEFCGFLIHVVTDYGYAVVDITIKRLQEVDEYPPFNFWQESDKTFESRKSMTYVGYVPFSSLRHTSACLNSTYNMISFSLRRSKLSSKCQAIGAALVPRKSKDDHLMQTPKAATGDIEFQDEKYDCRPTFTIQHDSKSYIKILWEPETTSSYKCLTI